MRYLNTSHVARTFYGVKFNPGEIKEVNGYINDPHFVQVKDSPKNSGSAQVTQSRTSTKETKTTTNVEAK